MDKLQSQPKERHPMTKTAKILLTLVIVGAVAFGAYRWKDKLAPPPATSSNPSVDPQALKQQLDAQKLATQQAQAAADKATAAANDITSKLLAGTNSASLVSDSTIPRVAGTSDYDKTMKNGKLVVQFPINVWPGWAPPGVRLGLASYFDAHLACTCSALNRPSGFKRPSTSA